MLEVALYSLVTNFGQRSKDKPFPFFDYGQFQFNLFVISENREHTENDNFSKYTKKCNFHFSHILADGLLKND